MNFILRAAIAEMKLIEFSYDGQNRVVEPHCFGLSTAGNACVRGFQVGGGSLSGGVPDWRLFELSKMRNLRMLENVFLGPRPGYRKGDRGMDRIHAEL